MTLPDKEGDVYLAKEKFKPLKNLFQEEIFLKRTNTVTTRIRYPTQKQWLYVKYLFEGYPQRAAYKKAGYKMDTVRGNCALDRRIYYLHQKRSIQVLINAVLSNYLKRRQISAQHLVDETLKTYDRCETVKDQLATLKFLKTLLPKGYAGQCNLANCPIRKQKK